MAKQVFDTYSAGEDQSMLNFVDRISQNRILIFSIKVGQSLGRGGIGCQRNFVLSLQTVIGCHIYRSRHITTDCDWLSNKSCHISKTVIGCHLNLVT